MELILSHLRWGICFFPFLFHNSSMGGIGYSVVISLTFLILGVLVIGCHPYKRMMPTFLDCFIIMTISISIMIFYLTRISSVITRPILLSISFLLCIPFLYMLSCIYVG